MPKTKSRYPETVKESLLRGKAFLKEKSLESFSLDAALLLSAVTGFTKIQLVTKDKTLLSAEESEKYTRLLNRRALYEPVQYILNHAEFMGIDFYVDKNVLIPRPDTEILVESALEEMKKFENPRVLEIGTGSGCISISLKKFMEKSKITAVDISEKALDIAKRNAITNETKINFSLSDIFENVKGEFDILVSNPPYIETDVIETLGRNVKEYEPINALDGGKDGLYFYDKIIEKSGSYLSKNAVIIFEIGYNQRDSVFDLLKKYGYKKMESKKDYSGMERVVLGWMGE